MDSVLWASGGSAYHCGLRVTQDVSIVSTAAGKPKGSEPSGTKRKRPSANISADTSDGASTTQADARAQGEVDHAIGTPDFLSVGYWLMEKKIPVRALAGAVREHGIVTFDDLDMPQHHKFGTPQTEAALDVLRACLARRQDPEPFHDSGFEQDDHDWPGYRYGWLSTALPNFEAIERASFAMITAKTLGQSTTAQPFTTLYELLKDGLATTASLDNAIHSHGVYERRINEDEHVDAHPAHITAALAALAASTVDPYKGPDPTRSLWGADNPLHTHGWPGGEVPRLALDVRTPTKHTRNQYWQNQLERLFDPDFTTVGCLLITGRAKPSAIAAAVYGEPPIEHRRAHNLPQPVKLPWRCSFADVAGPMGRLSQCIHQLSGYERDRLPIPIKEFQDAWEVLADWGWSFKTLPDKFRLPVVTAAEPAVAAASDLPGSARAAEAVLDTEGQVPPPTPAAPIHTRTKNSYLALIGVLLDIVQYRTPVHGYDKTTKQWGPRKAGEDILDADIIHTIEHFYQGLDNVSKSAVKKILAELKVLHTQVPDILIEARKLAHDSHLMKNEKAARRKKEPKSK